MGVACALLFGTAPALRASAVSPIEVLKEHGRGASTGTLSSGLVITQVALSLVLVFTAGLFVQTFRSLATVRLGIDADRVLVVTVNSQRAGINADERIGTYQRVIDAIRRIPGVASAAFSLTTLRGVNYFCRLRTTISAGEGSANELAGDRSGAR